MRLSLVLAALLAVVPGFVAWWTGRRLLRCADDPALPELLLDRQRRLGVVGGVVCAVLIVAFTRYSLWMLALLALALLVAAHPVRRSLLGETWALGPYLWYSVRAIAGGLGFWIVLMLAPSLVAAAGPHRWTVAGALATLLVAWEWLFQRIWLRATGASPLARDDLTPRFDDLVRRAGIEPPLVYRIGAPGARIMNAVALPSTRRSAVALTDTLLELLSADEVVAVFAHEVAHLEHFTRRRMWQSRVAAYLLIGIAVGLPLATAVVAPTAGVGLSLLWGGAVLVALAARAAKSRAHETESDLRAIALCGDAEALVRGLIKLHVHSRLPRRWPIDFERRVTHPSLARRIQAIRAHAGLPAAALGGPIVVASSVPGSYVGFDEARAYWFEGAPPDSPLDVAALRACAPSYRAVAYTDLAELHVVAGGDGRALKATDRAGASWSVPLQPSHVAAAQRALDAVDARLGREAAQASPLPARVLAVLMLAALIVAEWFGLVVLPIIATFLRPGTAALAALGAVGVGSAVAALAAGRATWGSVEAKVGLAAMTLVGLAALWLAVRRVRAREQVRAERRGGLAIASVPLGTVAIALLVAVTWSVSAGVLDVSGSSPPLTSLALASLGAGAALATSRRRAVRRAGGATVVAALAVGVVALRGERALGRADGIRWTERRASEVSRASVRGPAYTLHLSPRATRFAVMVADAEDGWSDGRYGEGYEWDDGGGGADDHRWAFVVGSFDGAQRRVDAADVAFADEERVLALAAIRDRLELRLERADSAGPPLWCDTLPRLGAPQLVVDRRAGTWAVVGRDRETGELVAFTAPVNGGTPRERRWQARSTYGTVGIAFGGAGPLIVPALAPARALGGATWLGPLLLFGIDPHRWDVWRFGDDGQARVATLPGMPECGEVAESGVAACMVRERGRTTLWSVSAGGDVARLGSVPPVYGVASAGTDGWLAVTAPARTLALVDARARRGLRVAIPDESALLTSVHAGDGWVATVRGGAPESTLTLYRVQ